MSEQERVVLLARRVQELAQETFYAECEGTDQPRNMAVLAGALVRAGTVLMCRFCPPEQIPEAVQTLAMQIGVVMQEISREMEPLPQGDGEAANEVLSPLMPGHVEQEIGEPQQDPEEELKGF